MGFSAFPFAEVVGGYRFFDIDIDQDDVLLDCRQKGPYAGASLIL